MSKKPDIQETLLAYKRKAQDKTNHPILIKDKTMSQFLAYCLDSSDIEVVKLALETLKYLIDCPNNRPKLRTTFGIVEALQLTSQRNDLDDNMKDAAKKLLDILENGDLFISDTYIPFASFDSPMKFPSKIYSFHIFGLNEETRVDLETNVVKIRGVISVQIDVAHQRCILRCTCKVTPEIIARTVMEKTIMKAHLILKNHQNQEILSDPLNPNKDDVDNAVNLPEYLPEDESPVKEKALLSLDNLRSSASTWFKSAANFLQESFYW